MLEAEGRFLESGNNASGKAEYTGSSPVGAANFELPM